MLVKEILEGAGIRVETASSVRDAIEVLAVKKFDVIVSDVVMPGLDGCDFLSELQWCGIDTPVIALTAYAFSTDVNKAVTAGSKRIFETHRQNVTARDRVTTR
jgi:CheY-like chemotaxis protein